MSTTRIIDVKGKKVKYTKRPLAKPAVRKIVKKMIKGEKEKKRFVFGITGDVDITGSVSELTGLLIKGDGRFYREGEKIELSSLYLRYRVYPADIYNMLRCMIIATTENMPTITSVGDFFIPKDSGNEGVYSTMFVDTHKFKVLYDKVHFVNQLLSNNGISDTAVFNKIKSPSLHKVKINRKLYYNATTGTADKYKLYWVVFSDSTATYHPQLSGQLMLNFTDSG